LVGAFVALVLIAVVGVLAVDQGSRTGSFDAVIVSVSKRDPSLNPDAQMVCASGAGRRVCTAVDADALGAPFRNGDCVSIDLESPATRPWQPRDCD
jgi:hypothetical protein